MAASGLVGGDGKDAPKDPRVVVLELIRLTLKTSWQKIRMKAKKAKRFFKGFIFNIYRRSGGKEYKPPSFMG